MVGDLGEGTVEVQTRVFVLCCNRLLRESVARILNKKKDFEVLLAEASGTGLINKPAASSADVLVCDSLQYVGEEKLNYAKSAKLLLVAMEDSPETFLAAVRLGALGYVLLDASAADVVSAIRVVASGEAVCPAKFTKLLFGTVAAIALDSAPHFTAQHPPLTRREQQLIPLIGRGLTNKEIASQLNLSEQTIKSHIHRLLRKVRAENRQSLAQIRYDSDEHSPNQFSN